MRIFSIDSTNGRMSTAPETLGRRLMASGTVRHPSLWPSKMTRSGSQKSAPFTQSIQATASAAKS